MKKLEAIHKIKELSALQKKIADELGACYAILEKTVEKPLEQVVSKADDGVCVIKTPHAISFSEFGALLKGVRKSLGTTQVELAKKINKPHNYLVKLENGTVRTMVHILSYIDALNHEIWVSIDGIDLPFDSLDVFKSRILKIVLERKPISVLCAEIGCTETYLKMLATKTKNFGLEIFLKTVGCVGGTIVIRPKRK